MSKQAKEVDEKQSNFYVELRTTKPCIKRGVPRTGCPRGIPLVQHVVIKNSCPHRITVTKTSRFLNHEGFKKFLKNLPTDYFVNKL